MDQQMGQNQQNANPQQKMSAGNQPGSQSDTGLDNLAYDWVTLLHEKTKGLRAYDSYIQDARQMKAQDCVELLERIRDADRRQVEEIKQHVMQTLGGQMGGQMGGNLDSKQMGSGSRA
jgi:hypothetical protein